MFQNSYVNYVEVFEEILKNQPPLKNSSRSCSQKCFDILIHGENLQIGGNFVEVLRYGGQKVKNKFDYLPDFRSVENFKPFKTVYLKGKIFVFSRNAFREEVSVKEYCLIGSKWSTSAKTRDKRNMRNFCALVDTIYVFGGAHDWKTDPCLQFDTRRRQWREFGGMKKGRVLAACAVFNGRVVVSGGNEDGGGGRSLDSVEAYDGWEWGGMPRMVRARYNHEMFAVKNKLFVIGWKSIEMLNGDKFVEIKWLQEMGQLLLQPVWVHGNSVLFVLVSGKRLVASYDAVKNKWFKESFEETESINYKIVLKIHQM